MTITTVQTTLEALAKELALFAAHGSTPSASQISDWAKTAAELSEQLPKRIEELTRPGAR